MEGLPFTDIANAPFSHSERSDYWTNMVLLAHTPVLGPPVPWSAVNLFLPFLL